MENQESPITLDEILSIFREIDLLSHYSPGVVEQAVASVQEKKQAPGMLLYALPNLIYGFDSEGFWDEEGYRELIEELQVISHGQFTPKNLTITADDNKSPEGDDRYIISLELGGEPFRFEVENLSDWVDSKLIQKINGSLSSAGEAGEFYWMCTYDQVCVLVFLTPDQFEVLKEIYAPDLRKYTDSFLLPREITDMRWKQKLAETDSAYKD